MKPIRWAVLSAGLFLYVSCTQKILDTAYPTLRDGRFDSEFPYRDCSVQLRDVGETIRMLYSTAYYKTFTFGEHQKITVSDLADILALKKGKESFSHNSVVGTATTIFFDGQRVALLTCSHIVDFPDSITYLYPGNQYVKSYTLKEKQINFIRDFPESGELEVIARDPQVDIAIIGKKFSSTNIMMPVFKYPIGRSKDLEWGTFIYIMGFPMGHKMITKGIVSSPNKDKKGSFLTDAPFNRGFSGGAVLAIRDGVPNFELVGLAKSVSAISSYVLTPSKEYDQSLYDPGTPYSGDIFVDQKTDIRYGITSVISTETIKDFFDRNEQVFKDKGYDFKYLFGK